MRHSTRGAAVVELAIALPLLLLLALGVAEYGNLLVARSAYADATRAAAMTAIDRQADPHVDYHILRSAVRLFDREDDQANLLRVIVYDPGPDGAVDRSCLRLSARRSGGVEGICNVYTASTFRDVRWSDTSGFGDETCSAGVDRFFCPADRDNGEGATVGLWMEVRYRSVTGFFSQTQRLRFAEHVVISNEDVGYEP